MKPYERIKLILEESKISQVEIAKAAGVSKQYIGLVLSDKLRVTQMLANTIELRFGYRADWILNGDEDKYAENTVVHIHKMEDKKKDKIKKLLTQIEKIL